ncbi:Gfo/Idh/MocA family oxidoreductase [Carboxydochorda subterranea]|uniref:Gfo/Idh/MocA family oxidoreductase n=1 Tax=Carboxydichorda subterranea TaxID=3109565 RepID=A0ABZ1BZM6_9FIRM|nr:Gfo/Idh/MocA family oxidoreductase [Limnochorda sp. L945t]WRP17956.1 Gfo/Idh/MocA family oxidoreductase [Limnochorda sp. L945t]
MSGRPIRVGIIGAGGIATGAHIPGYQALGDQVELVAVADVDGERARRVAAEFGFARSYTDYHEMLAQETLDAVSVCTPNKFHAPATIAALRAGCHVLCEKPPATTVLEAQAMREAAAAAGRILTFGFHMRFKSEAQAAYRFVAAGELGEIYAGRVTAMRRRGIPSWGVFTNKALQGGGPLVDIGVHVLDLALWLMDYPQPETVLGATFQKLGTRPGVAPWGPWDWQHYEVEDMAHAMIRFANGASLLLETSFAANIEPMDEMNVRLQGTEGGLTLQPLRIHREAHETLVDVTPAWLPTVKPHHAEVAHFVRCIRGEAQPLSTPDQAVALQQIVDAIYQSAETRTPIRLVA